MRYNYTAFFKVRQLFLAGIYKKYLQISVKCVILILMRKTRYFHLRQYFAYSR